jgi:hypothetical protein
LKTLTILYLETRGNFINSIYDLTDVCRSGKVGEPLYESIGSRRKRLLQMSNQTTGHEPFLKQRLPSQAAFVDRHIGITKQY